MIKSLETILTDKFGLQAVDASIRRELASTMHARPVGLLLGAACGMAAGGTVLFTTQYASLRWAALAMVVLAFSRVATGLGATYLPNNVGKYLRQTYWIGALVYAATAGFAAALSLLLYADTHIQVLMVGFALIFGAGLALGNAGRPIIALSQMILTFLPIVIACVMLGSPALIALALILPSLTLGLTFVTMNVFATLAGRVSTAHESADLARQMRDQALTDPVTGLANRTGFEAGAQKIIDQHMQAPSETPPETQSRVALFWLDLHRFKEVNDVLGHQVGDRVLRGTDRLRAQQCLTLSVYYEAASEAADGQRAVAQVVMNRVRHPSYPNSVCGVVFQGSDRSTGCQFSFTCDGSLSRRPERGAWARASHVASAAMGGFVDRGVGLSTHYHTVNVNPYWASSLDHVTTIGLHRFYRWSGSAGQPGAFNANYGGNEPLPVPTGPAPNVPNAINGATSAVVAIPSFAPYAAPAQVPAASAEIESSAENSNLPQSGAVLEQYSQSGNWLDEPGQ